MCQKLARRPVRAVLCSLCRAGCLLKDDGWPPLCHYCRKKALRRETSKTRAPLRGTPCLRCGLPLGRSLSGYCGACSCHVRCPVCGTAHGSTRLCGLCREGRPPASLAREPVSLRKALDADPARVARVAAYAERASLRLPLFGGPRP